MRALLACAIAALAATTAAPLRTAGAAVGQVLAQGVAQGAVADARRAAVDTAARGERIVAHDTQDATRAELQAALARSERSSGGGRSAERTRQDAEAIRRRLRDGDFRAGDRFLMTNLLAPGDTAMREVAVRAERTVEFPLGIPPLSLVGVLRSELPDAISAHVARYVRDSGVRVRPLVRIAVTGGGVAKPGFYSVPTETRLAEVLQAAGGTATGARLEKLTVTRDGKRIVDAKQFVRLSREGRTVAESDLRDGDEINVPVRTQRNTANTVMMSFFMITAVSGVLALIRTAYQ